MADRRFLIPSPLPPGSASQGDRTSMVADGIIGNAGHHAGAIGAAGGFTLFEVCLSALLVSFSVLSVLMIFPVGIRQAQANKFQVIAAAKAVEIVDTFASAMDEGRMLDCEVPEAWEGLPFCYSNNRWDLEQRVCNFRYGIQPLPIAIARRLDSDGDEIQRLLDGGAYIYYAMPMANRGLDERWQEAAPINESRHIIFAIAGSPQHNAVPRLPQKAWPYRSPYPSPPTYMSKTQSGQAPFLGAVPIEAPSGRTEDWWRTYIPAEWWLAGNAGVTGGRLDHVLGNRPHPLFEPMFKAFIGYLYFNKGYDYNGSDGYKNKVDPPVARLREYVERTMDYCKSLILAFDQVGGDAMRLDGMGGEDEYASYFTPMLPDHELLAQKGESYDQLFARYCSRGEVDVGHKPDHPHKDLTAMAARRLVDVRVGAAMRVQAMRHLAAALACLYSCEATGNARMKRIDLDTDGTSNVLLAERITVRGAVIDPGLIRYLHERSLAMIARYASCFPYDWGCPRPQHRQIMTDLPLIELDLFSPPRTGSIGGKIPAAQWKCMSAQPISNLGPSLTFPGSLINGKWRPGVYPYPEWDDGVQDGFWGNPAHFSLTKRFQPAERMRELVFWSVDWQQYEDAEILPSAPVDASRHPFTVPRDDTVLGVTDLDRRLTFSKNDYGRQKEFWRMNDNYCTHNPELRFLLRPSDALSTDTARSEFASMADGTDISRNLAFSKGARELPDYLAVNKTITFGLWGADRNFNKRLDKGPLSRLSRIRVSSIGRYLFYDPRIPLVMR